MEKYTIIYTEIRHGSITEIVDKDKVRNECEQLKSIHELDKHFKKKLGDNTHTDCRIEVINNETGEIREYWNSHDNKIEF